MMNKIINVFLLVSVSCCANAATLSVKQNGDSSFKSIQAAVNVAKEGDIIKISPGVYHETVKITQKAITLEGSKTGEVVIDGADPLFENIKWKHVKGVIYKTKYKWPHLQPTDEEFTTYGGGTRIGKIPMQVYEDGVLLRGYRNKHDKRYFKNHKLKKMGTGKGVLAGPYSELEQLDPKKSKGRLPKYYLRRDIRISGRFMYDEQKGELYVWSAKEDNPSKHEYAIPALINLIKIKADNVTLKNITLKNCAGRAIEIKDSEHITIEDCFLINNRYPINADYIADFTVKDCFIQEKGLWERYWYDDMKTTVMHGAAISVTGSENVKIFNNTIAGSYAGVRTSRAKNIKIYNNIISYCTSTGINATSVKTGDVPSDYKYNLQVFNNIIHHVDLNGAIAVSFLAYGPVWFYRNIVYCCANLSKNGSTKPENALGKTYFYNNTVALIKKIIIHPYSSPCDKSDVYMNNIFYVKYIRYDWYFAFQKRPDWCFFPFKKGPVLDGNLYWKPLTGKYKDDRIAILSTESKLKQQNTAYTREGFDMMKKEMDIEPRGFQADPCFENSDIIKNADVKKFNIDKFSFMDYRDVRKKGYAKLFKKSFAKLYNFFALEKDSPAINKGVKIPDEWPHTGIVKDSAPDIGAFEFDAVNGALLKSKKNVRSGFWSILGL